MKLDCDSAPARGLRRYVRLVAVALGPAVRRSAVDWGHPVNAHLVLNDRLRWFPSREVALGWDATEGWTMVLGASARGSRTVLRFLGDDPLPKPADVAAFSARMFHDEFTGQADPPPLPTVTDERDLAARLAGYAVPYRVHHRTRRVHLHGVITSWHENA